MTIAHIAVYTAIACTLWFNGSYAWMKGDGLYHQLGMVALAITIDLCKCSFLPTASMLYRNKWYIPAIVLTLLWAPALAYSTFAGYSYITTNRTISNTAKEGQTERRSFAKSTYDQTTKDLQLAYASKLWKQTSACTNPRRQSQRVFCKNIIQLKADKNAAAVTIKTIAPVHIDPEITVLKKTTGLPVATIIFWVALWPSLLIELVAGLGLYALTNRIEIKAAEEPLDASTTSKQIDDTAPIENAFVEAPMEPKLQTENLSDKNTVPPRPQLKWNFTTVN